jgi:hypothetical protein
MRRTELLLLLVVALVLAVEVQQQLSRGGSHSSKPPASAPLAAQARAEHLLTLLDFWNQELMPYVLLQGRARAHTIEDVAYARRLGHRLARGLTHLQRLLIEADRDPVLVASDSAASRAVEATRAAWAEWASASLRRRPPPAATLAALQAKAVRFDQAAYAAVDASLRTALKLSV